MVSYVSEEVVIGQMAADFEADKWKEKYKNFLRNLIDSEEIKGNGPYQDPDCNGSNIHAAFCEALTIFLNAREEKYKKILNGRYYYVCQKLDECTQIAVYTSEDYRKEKKPCFYLKSDQFGFSAPSDKRIHPYDVYLLCVENEKKEEAIENVANWICESRTIGGAFLWPMESIYNRKRGGSIRQKGTNSPQYYISDRVDLTLVEMKHIYDGQTLAEGDLLYNCYNKEQYMQPWLDHFKDFKTFCKFFCFQDFVYKVDDIPYDITKDWTKEKSSLEDYVKITDIKAKRPNKIAMKNEFWNQNAAQWEHTLRFVNECINSRTAKMEKIIADM
jgi:hypothetical protein